MGTSNRKVTVQPGTDLLAATLVGAAEGTAVGGAIVGTGGTVVIPGIGTAVGGAAGVVTRWYITELLEVSLEE